MNLQLLVEHIDTMDKRLAEIRTEISTLLEDEDTADSQAAIVSLISEFNNVLENKAKYDRARSVTEALTGIPGPDGLSLAELRSDRDILVTMSRFLDGMIQAIDHLGRKTELRDICEEHIERMDASAETLCEILSSSYGETEVLDVKVGSGQSVTKEADQPRSSRRRVRRRSIATDASAPDVDIVSPELDKKLLNKIAKQRANTPRISNPACPLTNWDKRDLLDAVIMTTSGDQSRIMPWLDAQGMSVRGHILRNYLDANFAQDGIGGAVGYDPEAHQHHEELY